jgi:hypothetical protein
MEAQLTGALSVCCKELSSVSHPNVLRICIRIAHVVELYFTYWKAVS